MTLIRSIAYQLVFLSWTLFLSLACLPVLAFASRRCTQRCAALWLKGTVMLQRTVLGLSHEIRGLENLPGGAAVIAAKHQSAWDTMIFHTLLGDPAFILKKELLSLPFIGWYMRKTGQVAIDRKGGIKALKRMVEGARLAVGENRQVIIFPEGHRQPPGVAGEYHSGVAVLYAALSAPMVPVALNSGLFWRRNALLRRPGVVTLQFLPAIPPGLDRNAFMDRLQERIESATRALELEALRRFPYLAEGLPGDWGVTDAVDNSVERKFPASSGLSVDQVDNPLPANDIKVLSSSANVETKREHSLDENAPDS
jgi:1-acyl-sn-glycerol-3-phosphate acyltransferase